MPFSPAIPADEQRQVLGRAARLLADVTQRVELLAAERRARSEAEAARSLVPDIADWCRIDPLDENGVLQRKLAWHSVRSMVERHGGSVRAHSQGEGRGATFTVSLPPSGSAPPPSPEPTHAPAGEQGGSGRILVVDDNADAAQTLAELLQVIGYETRTAPDAGVALQVFKEFRPQLALLDIGLPQVDGYQLAGLIRQEPEGQDVRLVALTGYGQESDRARALAAQFDEHLVKPVGIDRLIEVLQRFL